MTVTSQHLLTLTIPGRLDRIVVLRAALAGVFDHYEVSVTDNHLLGIAVAEIVNNAIEHGYQGDSEHDIEVRLQLSKEEVQIEIFDEAPEFPKSELHRIHGKPEPLEDPALGWTQRGHGLQIVRKIVDSISLGSERGRNCITLRKHISVGHA
jgi:serine/threonine-protein kinase RsbW